MRNRCRHVKINIAVFVVRFLPFARDKRIIARHGAKVIHNFSVLRRGQFFVKFAVAVERRSLYVAFVVFRSGVGHYADNNVVGVVLAVLEHRNFHRRVFDFGVEQGFEFFVDRTARVFFVVESVGYSVARLQNFLLFHATVSRFEYYYFARPQRDKYYHRHSDEIHPRVQHQRARSRFFCFHIRVLFCNRVRAT